MTEADALPKRRAVKVADITKRWRSVHRFADFDIRKTKIQFVKDKQMRRKSYLNLWKDFLGFIAFSTGTHFVE